MQLQLVGKVGRRSRGGVQSFQVAEDMGPLGVKGFQQRFPGRIHSIHVFRSSAARGHFWSPLAVCIGTHDLIDVSVVLNAHRRDQTVITSDPIDLRQLDPHVQTMAPS